MAGIDANCVGAENVETFYKANKFASELLTSTWIAITDSIAGELASNALNDALKYRGIIPIIRQCSDDADRMLHGEQPSDLGALIGGNTDLAGSLQVLRYPKRYSPMHADGVHKETLQKFLNRNNLDKLTDRRGYPQWLLDGLSGVIAVVLDGCVWYEPYSTEYFEKGYFSSGAVAGVKGKCRSLKIDNWEYPCFGYPFYPTSHPSRRPGPNYYYGDGLIVNKSFKTGRVIVKENETRAYYMQGLRTLMQDTLTMNGYGYLMPSEHQEFNQMLAHLGTCGEDYSTIDLSEASDSIPCGLVHSIFPQGFIHAWDELRSKGMYFGTKYVTCYMANTSGSPLCFDVEKIVFYAFARYASDLCERLGGYPHSLVTAMGDDIIIPSYAYDTLVDLLAICGIVVNESKSFAGDHKYRESCGYEAYDGCTTTSDYFPRKTITCNMACYDSVRNLHNVLFSRGWYKAADICKSAICQILGRVPSTSTLSQLVEYGSIPDLLGFIETGRLKTSDISGKPCEITVHDCALQKPNVRYKGNHDDYIMYQYTQYLIHGPNYATPLDKLLGVSESRLSDSDSVKDYTTVVRGDGGRYYI